MEHDQKPSTESEILEIKNYLYDMRDNCKNINEDCEKIKAQIKYTNFTQLEKELQQKIDENIRIKTTVHVLKNRLDKERRMFFNRMQPGMGQHDGFGDVPNTGLDLSAENDGLDGDRDTLVLSDQDFRNKIDSMMR